MADTKPSAFTTDTTPDDLDVVPFIDLDGGGAGTHLNRKLSLTDLTNYFEGRARKHSASIATQVTGAVDVYITDSGLVVPQSSLAATRLQARSKMTWDLSITKAAAGTGTPTFNIRTGTGVLGDTSRNLFTWPAANTAVADEMHVTIEATIRALSATVGVIEAELKAVHELTTTGFGGTGLTNVILLNVTSGNFDNTTAGLVVGLSVNPGTAGAWSIRQCKGVIENLA